MFRVCPGSRISLSFPRPPHFPAIFLSSVVVAFVAGSAHLHLLCCRCRLLTFFGFADDTVRLLFCAPDTLQKNLPRHGGISIKRNIYFANIQENCIIALSITFVQCNLKCIHALNNFVMKSHFFLRVHRFGLRLLPIYKPPVSLAHILPISL